VFVDCKAGSERNISKKGTKPFYGVHNWCKKASVHRTSDVKTSAEVWSKPHLSAGSFVGKHLAGVASAQNPQFP
jgi:hypothetical protein